MSIFRKWRVPFYLEPWELDFILNPKPSFLFFAGHGMGLLAAFYELVVSQNEGYLF